MEQTNNQTVRNDNYDDEIIINEGTEIDENSPFNKNVINRGESGTIGGLNGKGEDIEEPELIKDSNGDGDSDEKSGESKNEKDNSVYDDVSDFEKESSEKETAKTVINEEDEEGMSDEEIDVYANLIADKYFDGTRNLTISWSQFSDMVIAEMVASDKIDLDIEFAKTGKTIGEIIGEINENIETEINKTKESKPALVSILKAIAKKYGIKMSIGMRLVLFLSMDMLQMGTIIFTLKNQNKKMMKNFVLQTTNTRKRISDLEEKIKKESEKNEDFKEKGKNKNKNKKKVDNATIVSEENIEDIEINNVDDIDDSVVIQESLKES